MDFDGVSGHAFYKRFAVEDESTGYRLRAKGYSGDAGKNTLISLIRLHVKCVA